MKPKANPIIHIIDKSPAYCKIIESCLLGLGYSNFHSYYKSADWLEHATQPDIIILDYDLGEKQVSGLELLHAYYKLYTNTHFVFMSSNTNLDIALSAIKLGACDYILKSKQGLEQLVKKIDTLVRKKAEQKRKKICYRSLLAILGMICIVFITAIIFYAKHSD